MDQKGVQVRSCNECTKCCEGHLKTNIKGHEVYPGNPCFFVKIGVGCTSYEDRPKDPCQNFKCYWLSNTQMPEEFKPSNSGVILTWQTVEEFDYLALINAPTNPSVQLLSWALSEANRINSNFSWNIDNQVYWTGSVDFCDAMLRKVQTELGGE